MLFAALDERRQALSDLIAGIDDVSQQLSGFVADNRREFKPALDKLNAVMDNLLQRKEHIGEALRRLPPYATALGEVVGSGPGFQINLYGLPPASRPKCCWTSTSSPASCRTASPTCCADTSLSGYS